MNKVELEGALTRDPTLKFLPSGLAVAEFTIVVNDTKYDREKREQVAFATFLTCSVWGLLGEQFAEKVHQGDRIYVMGKLAQRAIEKEDGKKETKTRVDVLFWQPTMVRSVAAAGQVTGSDPWGASSHVGDGEPPF